MPKTKKELPVILKAAEAVIVNDIDFAFALSYTPRQTPVVIAKGRGRTAADIIWAAQELEVPIVETTLIGESFYSKLKEGEAVPSALYPPIGEALSFLFKTKDAPHSIRFIRLLRSRPSLTNKKAEDLTNKYSDIYSLSMISLEFGKQLFGSMRELKDPLDGMRRKIAMEIGLVVPEIIASYNSRLHPEQYNICIRGVMFLQGTSEGMELEEFMALLINRLRNLILKEAWQFLGYPEVSALLDVVKKDCPVLYKELFSKSLSMPSIRFILRNLLKEYFPIRDILRILEVVKDNMHITTDPDILTEYVRASFSQFISTKYCDENGTLNAILLSPEAEKKIKASINEMLNVSIFDMGYEDTFSFLNSIKNITDSAKDLGMSPIMLVSPSLRRFIRRFLDSAFPELPVLSYSEIFSFTNVRSFGIVT